MLRSVSRMLYGWAVSDFKAWEPSATVSTCTSSEPSSSFCNWFRVDSLSSASRTKRREGLGSTATLLALASGDPLAGFALALMENPRAQTPIGRCGWLRGVLGETRPDLVPSCSLCARDIAHKEEF